MLRALPVTVLRTAALPAVEAPALPADETAAHQPPEAIVAVTSANKRGSVIICSHHDEASTSRASPSPRSISCLTRLASSKLKAFRRIPFPRRLYGLMFSALRYCSLLKARSTVPRVVGKSPTRLSTLLTKRSRGERFVCGKLSGTIYLRSE